MCIHVKIKLQFYFILLLQFFLPNFPARIEYVYASDGQMSGSAFVEFKTHQQAVEAVKRNYRFMCKSSKSLIFVPVLEWQISLNSSLIVFI